MIRYRFGAGAVNADYVQLTILRLRGADAAKRQQQGTTKKTAKRIGESKKHLAARSGKNARTIEERFAVHDEGRVQLSGQRCSAAQPAPPARMLYIVMAFAIKQAFF
jgi:hypothetical protein